MTPVRLSLVAQPHQLLAPLADAGAGDDGGGKLKSAQSLKVSRSVRLIPFARRMVLVLGATESFARRRRNFRLSDDPVSPAEIARLS